MRTIPEIRARLLEIADEVTQLALETKRKQSGRKASTQSSKITPELAARIVGMAKNNPDMPIQHIADCCKVNSGRVSEILAGYRKDK